VDLRARKSFAEGRDFAFWLYFFGTLAFWGGLTAQESNSELGKFIYMLINLGMVALGAILERRVFAVFGGIGIAFYLGHLSHQVFKDSLDFPFALTLIGLGIVAIGIWWQRNEARISAAMRSWLPAAWRELLESRDEALAKSGG
jgi:hypothetical protein